MNSSHEAHGKGILYTANNTIVQGGLFQHGKLHGEGFTNHPDGGRYAGEHRAGLREGFGKLSLANGDKYVGGFHNNLQSGRGTYTWAKGDVYDGYWSDVRMHGIGKYSWPDGIVYLGQFTSKRSADRKWLRFDLPVDSLSSRFNLLSSSCRRVGSWFADWFGFQVEWFGYSTPIWSLA